MKTLTGPTKEIDILKDEPLEVKTTEQVTIEGGTEKERIEEYDQIDNQPIENEEIGS